MKAQNVEFLWNSALDAYIVDGKLTGARIKNLSDGSVREVEADGVFVSIGRTPATELFKGEIELDERGYIIADETTKTNLSGVFAAGDVRTKELRQVVTAVADGAVAAHYAEEYLAKMGK